MNMEINEKIVSIRQTGSAIDISCADYRGLQPIGPRVLQPPRGFQPIGPINKTHIDYQTLALASESFNFFDPILRSVTNTIIPRKQTEEEEVILSQIGNSLSISFSTKDKAKEWSDYFESILKKKGYTVKTRISWMPRDTQKI